MSTKTFDLFYYIFSSLFGVGMMLLLIYLIGEVDGLAITAVILFGQTAHLSVRCTALQRQVNDLRREQDTPGSSVPAKV